MAEQAHWSQKVALQFGLLLFSSLIYLACVYKSIYGFESLISGTVAFVVYAISLGLIYSAFNFRRPLLTTFYLTAPAPIICLLIFLAVTAAFAGDPKGILPSGGALLGIREMFFVAYSLAFGVLAVLGCFVGIQIKSLIGQLILNMHHVSGGDPVRAAKIAAFATVAGGLLSMLAAVLTAVISGK